MQSQLSLDFSPPYRKGQDTSKAASETVKPSATILRLQVLSVMRREARGWTADEMAKQLGADILNVRPRFSELVSRKLITDTGDRRPNSNGNTQRVYAAS